MRCVFTPPAEADLEAIGDDNRARPSRPAHAQDASAMARAFSMRTSGKMAPPAVT
jgi:hypothetical protein